MKAYSFLCTVFADALDSEVIEDTMRQAVVDGLPDGTPVHVKGHGIKEYSEQGAKVARARLFGVTVKDAGDGHKASKAKKVEPVAVEA